MLFISVYSELQVIRKNQLSHKDKIEETSDALKSLISSTKIGIDSMALKFNDLSNGIEKKILELEEEMKQADKRAVLEINNIKNSDIKSVSERIASLQQQIMLVEQGFPKAEIKMSQINQRIDNCEARLNNFEGKNSSVENRLISNDKKLNHIESKMLTFEGDLSKFNIKETQISLIDNKLSTHEIKIKENEQFKSDTTQQLSQLSASLSSMQKDVEMRMISTDDDSKQSKASITEKAMLELSSNVRALSTNMKSYDIIIKQVNPQVINSELTSIKQNLQELKNFVASIKAHFNSYIDEHSIDMKCLFQSSGGLTAKMNIIEWWLRYAKYLSISASGVLCDTFLSLGMDDESSELAKQSHTSPVMATCISTLSIFKASANGRLLLLYSKVLEELLYNNQNYAESIESKIATHLYNLLSSKIDEQADTEQIRYIVRCIIFCMRDDRSKEHIVNSGQGLKYIIKTIEAYKDNEIVANTMKVLKLCFKQESTYAIAFNQSKNICSIILSHIEEAHFPSEDLLEQAAIKEAVAVHK